jgi:hypothetical protein
VGGDYFTGAGFAAGLNLWGRLQSCACSRTRCLLPQPTRQPGAERFRKIPRTPQVHGRANGQSQAQRPDREVRRAAVAYHTHEFTETRNTGPLVRVCLRVEDICEPS